VGDFRLEPENTLVVGMTGSGKTTFALRLLLNCPNVVCRFIFDDLGRAAARLRVKPAYTARELEQALATGWVIFNPHRMFPGDTKAAFCFFCEWVYNACCRGPGKKLLHVDEVWQWQDGRSIPRELALCAQTGREEGIQLVLATQLPHRVNDSITGQSTELVCFRLDEPKALDRISELRGEPDLVRELPLGSFIAYNRLTQGRITGKMWN
jgi:hypothetical protein